MAFKLRWECEHCGFKIITTRKEAKNTVCECEQVTKQKLKEYLNKDIVTFEIVGRRKQKFIKVFTGYDNSLSIPMKDYVKYFSPLPKA